MEEKPKTIYCGSGVKRSADWITATVQLNKCSEYFTEYEGKSYLRLNINIRTEPDQYGKDVALSVNTYKPDSKPVEANKSKDLPW